MRFFTLHSLYQLRHKELLTLLILADTAIISLHLFHVFSPFLKDAYFSVEKERSIGESYQHVKVFWVALLTIGIGIRRITWRYISWALVFIYLLLDDMTRIHEQTGDSVGKHILWSIPLGVGNRDLGELVVGSFFGLICITLLLVAYKGANLSFKIPTKIIVGLILALGLFGVCTDFMQGYFAFTNGRNSIVSILLGTIEDGGELIIMSIMVWFSYYVFAGYSCGCKPDGDGNTSS